MHAKYVFALFLFFWILANSWADPPHPNILLLCIDDLRPELHCYGVDYIHSPNIDALAQRGRLFRHHYVQAPTCGASRFTLLTGRYGPPGNNALFQRTRKLEHPSFPAWFRKHGYKTVSVGKVSHHPGGRGGKDWDDASQPEMPAAWDRHLMPCGHWQHPRGAMHGLANGEIRKNAKKMDIFQSFDGPDSAYPDGLITNEALSQLSVLAKSAEHKPFFLAVGIIRPHLPFGAPAKYLQNYVDTQLPAIPHPKKPTWRTTWHGSGEFMKYNRWSRNPNRDAEFASLVRKHYGACVSYADAQVGRILARLDALQLRDKTLVVLWGDHGWHLGEHSVWGKHTLFEESLRAPLIISCPGMSRAGEPTSAIVESIDLFPTICDLAGVAIPNFIDGQSLLPILEDPSTPGHTAISYHGQQRTIRTNSHRLVDHGDYFELYDHTTDNAETRNLASEQTDLVHLLRQQLADRLAR